MNSGYLDNMNSSYKSTRLYITLGYLVLLVLITFSADISWYERIRRFETFEFMLITLAAFRLTRLFMYDSITDGIREYFADPHTPWKTAFYELLTCVWCFGLWSATAATIMYLLIPEAALALLILAVAGVATVMQLTAKAVSSKLDN